MSPKWTLGATLLCLFMAYSACIPNTEAVTMQYFWTTRSTTTSFIQSENLTFNGTSALGVWVNATYLRVPNPKYFNLTQVKLRVRGYANSTGSWPQNVMIRSWWGKESNDYSNATLTGTVIVNITNTTGAAKFCIDNGYTAEYCIFAINISATGGGKIEVSLLNASSDIYPLITSCNSTNTTLREATNGAYALSYRFLGENDNMPVSNNVSYAVTFVGNITAYNGSYGNWSGQNNVVLNTSGNVTSSALTICASNGTYDSESFVDYSATGYSQRFYFTQNYSVLMSYNQTIYAYCLADADSTDITVYVRDQYQNLMSGMLVYAQRYFPTIDDYKSVAMGKTGPSGSMILPLYTGAWYKFIVMEGNTVMEVTDPQQLVDTTLTLYVGEEGDLSFFNYYGDVSASCYYNVTSKILVCTYADGSGKVQVMNMTVTEKFWNGTVNVVRCYDSSTAASGTLTCNLTNWQNRTLYYKLTGTQCCSSTTYFTWASGIIDLVTDLFDDTGLTGVMMGGILMLAVAGVAFYNPRIAIVMALFVFTIWSAVLHILPVDWTLTGGVAFVAVILLYLMGGRDVRTG